MEKRAEEFVNSKASEMNGLPPDKLTVIKWLTDFAKDEVEAIAVAHSCEKLPCENCGENKQLKYCEKCYNTAFDTENQ